MITLAVSQLKHIRMTNIKKIFAIIALVFTIACIQVPHIMFTVSRLSEFEGTWSLVHGAMVGIGIEMLIVALASYNLLRAAAGLMLVSSLFVIGFYFDGGTMEINFANSAIIMLSLAMPFASKNLGQFVIDDKGTDKVSVPKTKVLRPKNKPTSSLTAKIWDLKNRDNLSVRKIAEIVNLSKSVVGRMLVEMG